VTANEGGKLLTRAQTATPLAMQFIVPAQPKIRTSPPRGDAWIHEI